MIDISKEKRSFVLLKVKITKNWLQKIAIQEKKVILNLQYIICTNKKILKINKKYLKHDYYTDIITFDLSEDPKEIEGDIYISYQTIKENAKVYKTSIDNELKRVMAHGLLHLCGYNDQSEKDKKTMSAKEDYYLSLLETMKGST